MPIDRSVVTKKDIESGYDFIAEKMYVSEEYYDDILSIENDFSGDILEAGVGNGIVLKKILKSGGGRIKNLTGIDISGRLLELAKKNVPEATLVKGDVEEMPFPENSFDFVVMIGVFPYLLDIDRALVGVRRVLRPGGKFIVSVPNRKWILFGKYIKNRKNIQPVDDRFFDFDEMWDILEKGGLSVVGYRGADALRFYGWKHKFDILAVKIFPFLNKRMKHLVFKCVVKK